jgi:hypothetical protein
VGGLVEARPPTGASDFQNISIRIPLIAHVIPLALTQEGKRSEGPASNAVKPQSSAKENQQEELPKEEKTPATHPA